MSAKVRLFGQTAKFFYKIVFLLTGLQWPKTTKDNMEQLCLFSKEVMRRLTLLPPDNMDNSRSRDCDILNRSICEQLSFTGKYQMPVVKANKASIPKQIRALYRLTGKAIIQVVPHFYTSDNHFEALWTYPRKFIELLRRFPAVISTDFSIYLELTVNHKLWNIFRNKVMAAWWQLCGIEVIPNVSWTTDLSLACSFDGWPKHTMIAVNSTGIGTNQRCRHNWLDGYNAMLDVLAPTHILRYGARIEGEREDISTYYPNDNQIEARNGRK